MLPELRAFVLDFDGTIAETERDGHRAAYNAAFEELDLPWRWDADTYGALLATAGGKERLRGWISSERPGATEADVARLAAEIHESKRRHFTGFAARVAFRPGVARLVGEARTAGIVLAIATTAALDGVTAVLDRDPELASAFATISAGDVVRRKKPAPDIYLHALEALDVPARSALAFEDSALGLRAAVAAGLATLATPSSYNRDDDFSGATAVLSDLGEPDAPARVIAGLAPERGFVDVPYARKLLAAGARS